MSLRKTAKRIRALITAGPTREKIDPIRFISNYSTGTFGYEMAKEAAHRGWRVTLISGPTAMEPPKTAKFIRVESAIEMRKALLKEFAASDCVIMAAAVSDWRVRKIAPRKIKKTGSSRMTLELVENPDILKGLGERKGDKTLVGFALETEDLEANAIKKLMAKNLDLLVANRKALSRDVFGPVRTRVLIVDRFGNKRVFSNRPKSELAKIILDKVASLNIY